ncbi:WD40 repeat-like protein [Venustampulla echinocandica]|uniref:Sterol regulatory element-binding protein cleavage-activating protein n=1 Tax=Venustampulla echinocandica TaxID=2656787 RepID=A0A370TCU3_9HELO|nr:WD40 repeat-like protein [Venustampulla echinocandica]RDL32067.1 WD40 repeat-like protein [Venustampulla echinocandica]
MIASTSKPQPSLTPIPAIAAFAIRCRWRRHRSCQGQSWPQALCSSAQAVPAWLAVPSPSVQLAMDVILIPAISHHCVSPSACLVKHTTEPPDLDTKHPLRHSFTKYGNQAARRPVKTLLISVAVAAVLIYPFPFLYTNDFTNGASNLPHHVWTSAQPFQGPVDTRPDVVMRSIWVHGSYMNALQPEVLQSALEIQDELLGPTLNFDPRRLSDHKYPADIDTDLTTDMRDSFHASNGLTNSSWFFHSPLQYWLCSKDRIAGDHSIIRTVNEGSRQATLINTTLRHSIVFSGKRFEGHRLVAADTLVITLIHMLDSPVGRQWERKAEQLARRKSKQWRIIPPDGRSYASTLYEFRFQPLSFQDDLFLGVAYTATALYFFVSLSRMRALKSRLGLIIAVTVQIAMSIMSSFTICAIWKIDLSKIPREVYPLIILTVGLENIFRFINAVILTPSDRSTSTRTGEALGKTGYIALASVSQNIAILWMLSKIVSPQISAFCTFAALALCFDFFYLLTFFTAVLSIDVRRTELSDSLTRVSTRKEPYSTSDSQPRKTWGDAVLRVETAVSTRVAGTIVIIAFVIMAQWHFFDNESLFQTILRLWRSSSQPHPTRSSSTAFLSVDIHQARTPTSWLRMQDHETAHEVIQAIKPHANRYIAQVYDPLIFVLDGSDRTPTSFGDSQLLPAAQGFFIAVISILAVVSLLMNYLLWDELPEAGAEDRPDDKPLLSVKTLSLGHALDIVLLKASNDGIIATVGLDRWIRIWDIRNGMFNYIVQDPGSDIDPFPVLAMAIDNDSNWLALLSAKDKVMLWNIPERRWGPVMSVEIKGRTPATFCFGYHKTELIDPVLVVRHNGIMTEMHMETNETKELQICRSPLVAALPHFEKPSPQYPHPPPRILTSSKRGCVHVASQFEPDWVSEGLEIPDPEDDKEIRSILPLPALSSFLACRDHTVDLIDMFTHKVTHTFATKSMKPNTLRCFHSTRRRPQCGSVGLASLAIAYTCAETGSCILQSYLPQREGDTICFRDPWKPGSKTCCLWRETVEHKYEVQNPGEWQALQIGYVVGVRKRETRAGVKETGSHSTLSPGTSGLRRRGGNGTHSLSHSISKSEMDDEDSWEVWSINARGDRSSTPLCDANQNHESLLVNGLGPMEKAGKSVIAVALGNIIKVITVGSDKFDGTQEESDDSAFVGMAASRKKKPSISTRKRTA